MAKTAVDSAAVRLAVRIARAVGARGAQVDLEGWLAPWLPRLAARALLGFDLGREQTSRLLEVADLRRRHAALPFGPCPPSRAPFLQAWHDRRRRPLAEALLIEAEKARAPVLGGLVRDLGREGAGRAILPILCAFADQPLLQVGWTVWALARQDPVAARIASEVRHGAWIAADPIGPHTLVGRVLAESLRLYPSAPFAARTLTRPARIGDYDAPAGLSLVIPIWSIHRDRERWQEPHAFSPGRWETRAPDRTDYLPFGLVGTTCPAARLVQNLVGILIARLTEVLVFSPAPGVNWRPVLAASLLTVGPKVVWVQRR